MALKMQIDDVAIDVVKKDIRNLYLRVYPPQGRALISAPRRMSIDTIRAFAVTKLHWIRRQQQKLQVQARESKREYLDGESQHVWGRPVFLKVVERECLPSVELHPSHLLLRIRPGMDERAREAVVSSWYRSLLREAVPPLFHAWEPRLNVTVNGFYIRQMKTRWGSCNPRAHTIRLNTELARKPRACLEYVVVHEMVHLLAPSHGPKFRALMDRNLPAWRETKKLLNRSRVISTDLASKATTRNVLADRHPTGTSVQARPR